MSTPVEKELEILETIHTAKQDNKPIVQRDIAHIVGVSIGMTNAILKRLAKKGLLTIKKVNNRNIHYAVSPAGMRALSEKSYKYFKRTIKNVVYYKERIGEIVDQAVEEGCTKIVLVGKSDLDFIVEHFCMKHGIDFGRVKKAEGCEPGSGAYVVLSEHFSPGDEGSGGGIDINSDRLAYLQQVLV